MKEKRVYLLMRTHPLKTSSKRFNLREINYLVEKQCIYQPSNFEWPKDLALLQVVESSNHTYVSNTALTEI